MEKRLVFLAFACLWLFFSFPEMGKTEELDIKHFYQKGQQAYDAANYQEALIKWHEGLERAQKTNLKLESGIFLNKIGITCDDLGRHSEALTYYQRALAINQEIHDRINEAHTLNNMGLSYANSRQYDRALHNFKQALAIYQEVKNRFHEGNALTSIAKVKLELGQFSETLTYTQQALVICRALKDRRAEAYLLYLTGKSYKELKNYNQALDNYELALKVSQEVKNPNLEGNILNDIGGIHLQQNHLDKAKEFFQQALEVRKTAKNLPGEATTLNNLGVVYEKLGNYQQSLIYLQQTTEVSQKIGFRFLEGTALNSISSVYEKSDQPEKALSPLQKARQIWKELRDWQREGQAILQLCSLYQKLGKNDQAIKDYQEVITISRKLKNHQIEGSALNDLGLLYRDLGYFNEALQYLQEALAVRKKAGDQLGVANTLITMADVFFNTGRYELSLESCQQSLTIGRKIKDPEIESKALNNLGSVYLDLGLYEESLHCFSSSLALSRKMKIRDTKGEAITLNNIGIVLRRNKRLPEAVEYYQQALQIMGKIKDQRHESTVLNNIGNVYHDLGRYEEALQYFQQALVIKQKIKDRSLEALTLGNMGMLHNETGHYDQAYQAYNASLKLCLEIGNLDVLWLTQRGLGKALAKMGRTSEALTHYEQALDTLESLRSGLGAEQLRLSFMEQRLFVYDELIDLLNFIHQQHPAQGYNKKSWEIFERKQGRLFLEEIGKSGARNFAGIPAEVIDKDIALENRFQSLTMELRKERENNNPNLQRVENLRKELQQTKTACQSLKEEIKLRYPTYFALKYPQPAQLAELQQQVLQPGEIMLVYGVMKENSYLWIISKEQFRIFPLKIREQELQTKVEALRQGIEVIERAIDVGQSEALLLRQISQQQSDFCSPSRELFNILVPEEAREMLSAARLLYVIPTGPLYGLPFETLITANSNDKAPQYLVRDYSVAYLSSASLLKTLREARAQRHLKAKFPLLAFAHPIYQKVSLNKKVIQKSGEKESRSPTQDPGGLAELRSRKYLKILGQNSFPELPETEEEVRTICENLHASEESQPLQLREHASRSQVLNYNQKGKLLDYQYLIFSCHGILPGEVDRLNQPALVLSLPDPQTKKEGFLTMADVFGLKLNAELVTLSACNTGRGELQKGEGVIGLTRAFMYAGTPAISVTLWPVESQSVKNLSIGLYQNLAQGKGRATALRESKLRLIKGEAGELYQHPFFWAPMIMFGEGH